MFKNNKFLWAIWFIATAGIAAAYAGWTFIGGDRSTMVIGETTSAHHQFEVSCDSCHAADFFADGKKVIKKMNKTCIKCHKDELKISNDSHPVKKFLDPRNADRLQDVDARYCTACHMEHRPELTRENAVTLPLDFCKSCHEEIEKERPSHKGYGFETCATAGCHNYHDNRALYEDFLVKHAKGPDLFDEPILKETVAFRSPKTYKPKKLLTKEDALAPEQYLADTNAVDEWAASPHAKSGVNCAGCHAPKLKKKKALDIKLITEKWIEKPTRKSCVKCHRNETESFSWGKHGAREHPKLAKPRKTPKWVPEELKTIFFDEKLPKTLSVSEGKIKSNPGAHHLEIGTCSACHGPHTSEKSTSGVEACATCHEDDHTKAYFQSAHYDLWKKEQAGTAPVASGVSCADCHMPKIENDDTGDMFTTHNQNAYFRPNEKMIRTVCLDCHGLKFSIDALADETLVNNNFQGKPTRHIESIDWATRRVAEKETKK